MIRLRIKYDTISPLLRIMSGILYVEEVDTAYTKDLITLFKCKVSKEANVVGFSALTEGEKIPSKLFNCLKPIVDTMLHSYWKGLTLSKDDYNWVQMKGDDSWECLDQLEEEVGNYIAQQTQDGTKKDEVLSED